MVLRQRICWHCRHPAHAFTSMRAGLNHPQELYNGIDNLAWINQDPSPLIKIKAENSAGSDLSLTPPSPTAPSNHSQWWAYCQGSIRIDRQFLLEWLKRGSDHQQNFLDLKKLHSFGVKHAFLNLIKKTARSSKLINRSLALLFTLA